MHGNSSFDAIMKAQYHKSTKAVCAIVAHGRQVGGVSPLKVIGVAPVTVPMVALSQKKIFDACR